MISEVHNVERVVLFQSYDQNTFFFLYLLIKRKKIEAVFFTAVLSKIVSKQYETQQPLAEDLKSSVLTLSTYVQPVLPCEETDLISAILVCICSL